MNKKYAIYLPFMFALVLIIGIFLGSKLRPNGDSFGLFSSKYDDKSKISDILNLIEKDYVDTIDCTKLTEQTIAQILQNLDPHSSYFPAVEYLASEEELEGNFDGIGVQFKIQNDTVVVVIPIPDGPSYMVGIKSGDRICKVDGKNIAGVEIDNKKIMSLLKGKGGTKVHLSIFRKTSPTFLEFDVIRGRIPTYSIDASYLVSKSIGYVKINSFTQTTCDEFYSAVEELQKKGMRKLILDLRDNPGGLLSTAICVADQFLDKEKVIVYQEGRNRKKSFNYASDEGQLEKSEIVVLINEFSASASEIVAGALQDNDRATIVGRRSFGKGLVQEPFQLEDGSALRLTVARYFTPAGRCIQRSYLHGSSDYYADIEKRYVHGEMTNQDSIQKNDTTKYYTKKGKIVYGGGGITPDFYIPIDTGTMYSTFNHIVNSGILYQFAFVYTDENRQKLESYKTVENFTKSFVVSENILLQLSNYAKSKGIKVDNTKFQFSKKEFSNQLKALIAKNIFDNKGFYPIWNLNDKMVLKAISVLEEN